MHRLRIGGVRPARIDPQIAAVHPAQFLQLLDKRSALRPRFPIALLPAPPEARRLRSGCCARATSGHAAAALPSSVMKSRRFTSSMRLPLPENPLRYRCASLSHPQPAAERWASFLGTDPNRPE